MRKTRKICHHDRRRRLLGLHRGQSRNHHCFRIFFFFCHLSFLVACGGGRTDARPNRPEAKRRSRDQTPTVVMTLTAATSTALRRYASISGRSVAASAPAGMRSPAALVQQQTRGFAVVNLSDESAVEKFRNINSKSVLYFTAR